MIFIISVMPLIYAGVITEYHCHRESHKLDMLANEIIERVFSGKHDALNIKLDEQRC